MGRAERDDADRGGVERKLLSWDERSATMQTEAEVHELFIVKMLEK